MEIHLTIFFAPGMRYYCKVEGEGDLLVNEILDTWKKFTYQPNAILAEMSLFLSCPCQYVCCFVFLLKYLLFMFLLKYWFVKDVLAKMSTHFSCSYWGVSCFCWGIYLSAILLLRCTVVYNAHVEISIISCLSHASCILSTFQLSVKFIAMERSEFSFF